MSAALPTASQMQIVQYINWFRAREQCNPTMAEISGHFGWASPNAAAEQLAALTRKGVILKRAGKARGYLVLREYAGVQ